MCHMMYCPPGHTPPREYLEAAVEMNPHGFGSGWVAGRTPVPLLRHTLDGASAVDDFFHTRKMLPQATGVFHARFATGTPVSLDNCHPAWSEDMRQAVAHNGYLFPVPDGDERSDTRIFAEELLPLWDLNDVYEREELEEILGYNKMIVLDTLHRGGARSWILNQGQGVWEDEIWYSNNDFRGGKGHRLEAIEANACAVCGLTAYKSANNASVSGARLCDLCTRSAELRYDRLLKGPSR